jgi:hypothetical protein
MTPDGQDARTATPDDSPALTAEEIARLIQFFRVLEGWDRHDHNQDVSWVDQRTKVGTIRPE